jgi:hypothetical protein
LKILYQFNNNPHLLLLQIISVPENFPKQTPELKKEPEFPGHGVLIITHSVPIDS